MSQQLEHIAALSLHAGVDLFAGMSVSSLINLYFKAHAPSNSDNFKLAFSSLVQAVLTVLVADELRNLFWENPQEDPTGGILFIVTLFQQPTLWAKMNQLYSNIFKNFMVDQNDNANPSNISNQN